MLYFERIRCRLAPMAALALFVTAMFTTTSAFGAIAFRAASSVSLPDGDITFVGSRTRTGNNATSATIARPAAVAENDLMLAHVTLKGVVAAVTAPNNWNLLDLRSTTGATPVTQAIYWRVAGVTEPASYVWSWVGARRVSSGIVAYRNVEIGASPIDAWGAQSTDNDGTINLPDITTNTAHAMLVALLGSSRSSSHSLPTGMSVERYDVSAGGGATGVTSSAAQQVQAVPGATGAKTSTIAGGAADNIAHLVALRPRVLTLAVPMGTVANDVMIASITVRACSSTSGGACTLTVVGPAGWTLIDTMNQTTGAGTGGFGNRLLVYWRVATAAEPASYAWSFGGTPVHAGAAGGILSFSGVDTANPIVANAGQVTPGSYNHAAPSINTGAVTNTMLVSTHTANSSATWTPQAGMTEQVDIASLTVPDSLGLALQMNYEFRAAAGATGPRTSTLSNPPANDTGATHMLALRPSIDHYAISYPNGATALTCESLTVRITGHDTGHTVADVPAGTVTTLNTSTGTGVWLTPVVSGTGTWTPSGANNGQASYTWPGGESVVELRIRHTTALASIGFNLGVTYVEAATEDPAAAFVDAAFRVTDGTGTASASIGNQISGKNSDVGAGAQSRYLQAIRTDMSTGSCTTVFQNQTVSVELASECNNPTACVPAPGGQVSVRNSGGSMVAVAQNNGGAVGSYTAVSLAFDAQSKTPLVLSYPDAGQLTLHARYALPAPPAATYMTGASNAFVVRPFGFAMRGANAATAIQHGTTAVSPLLVPAGDNFTMTLAAYRWASGEDANNDGVPDNGVDITNNGFTPNYRWDTAMSVSASLPATTLGTLSLEHADTTRDGTVRQGEWTNGVATFTTWRYTEVGNALFTATANNYIAAGVTVSGNSGNDGTGSAGGYVGRFRPKHFRLDAGVPPTLTDRAPLLPCASSFTYMGEPMRMTFRLLAQNTQNGTTQNYTGAYAKLDPTAPANFNFGARSGTTDLSARTAGTYPAAAPAWANGILDMPIANPLHVSIARAVSGPDGRFLNVQLGIAPTDSDGVAMASYDLDVDNNAANDHTTVATAQDIRYGRLVLQNAFGSELLPLPVPMRTQYYLDGSSGFVFANDDNCTTIPSANLRLSNGSGTVNGAGPITVGTSSTSATIANSPFSNGNAGLSLSAPGAGGNGYVDVTLQPGLLPPYLLFDWDGNGVYDNEPSGRATFGVYQGNPKQIYLRERY